MPDMLARRQCLHDVTAAGGAVKRQCSSKAVHAHDDAGDDVTGRPAAFDVRTNTLALICSAEMMSAVSSAQNPHVLGRQALAS